MRKAMTLAQIEECATTHLSTLIGEGSPSRERRMGVDVSGLLPFAEDAVPNAVRSLGDRIKLECGKITNLNVSTTLYYDYSLGSVVRIDANFFECAA